MPRNPLKYYRILCSTKGSQIGICSRILQTTQRTNIKKILSESDLTFQKALKIAQATEKAHKNACSIRELTADCRKNIVMFNKRNIRRIIKERYKKLLQILRPSPS